MVEAADTIICNYTFSKHIHHLKDGQQEGEIEQRTWSFSESYQMQRATAV